ncbi:MAG: winged helix-turn-helix transcriptional regulator [Candidatus Micrarchaeota archaeon]|nr:winged helix-turn-helix transcriptional regulator [Candidatus Micrarchaeota archaeon]
MMKTPEKLFFTALGNDYRYRILTLLMKKPMSVNALAEKLGIEQSNLSHHLKCLLDCRFVEADVKGRTRIYRLSPATKELVGSTKKYINYYGGYLKKCGMLS